jgi:hypothetical protein
MSQPRSDYFLDIFRIKERQKFDKWIFYAIFAPL